MKRILLIGMVVPAAFGLSAQSSTQEYLRVRSERVERFRRVKSESVRSHRDSVNREFGRFLEEKWQKVKLSGHEVGFEPVPLPAVKPVPTSEPKPVPPPVEPVKPLAPGGEGVDFYGVRFEAQGGGLELPAVNAGVEASVARMWRQLAGSRCEEIVEEYRRRASEMGLDDWGRFLLVYETLPAYSLGGVDRNQSVVWAVFMLNQMGYKAKIGSDGRHLYALLASESDLHNLQYFTWANERERYYVVNPEHYKVGGLTTCRGDYGDSRRSFEIGAPERWPLLGGARAEHRRSVEGVEYECSYNPDLVRYMATYPCMGFREYLKVPISSETIDPIERQLRAAMSPGASMRERVQTILRFIHNGFAYRTDQDNYGYEKWNFPEETLVCEMTDCDDNAILFCGLVRRVLGLDVAVVHYPGRHLAAAVGIERMEGDATAIDSAGREYVICDPTFFGASVGEEMPSLRAAGREVIGF